MSQARKIRRSKKDRVHIPPRATALVFTAKGDSISMTVKRPARPKMHGPEREADRALYSLALEAADHVRKLLEEVKEDTLTGEQSERVDNASPEGNGS